MRAPPPGCHPDSILLSFPVSKEHAGVRVDRFIQTRIPRLSRTRAQKIVRACAYTSEGRKLRPSARVRAGHTVYLVRPPMNEAETPQHFGVIFQDEALLIVDKPAGLPMHPTASFHRNTLKHLLVTTYAGASSIPTFAHRLDRETSGVVACGMTSEDEVYLKKAFQNREVQKKYLAIVHGELLGTGTIDTPMAPVREGLQVLMECRSDGLKAVTRFEALEHRGGATLVALYPTSGRQHQLRVHLRELGHPIIGDKLYGAENETPFLEMIDHGPSDALLRRLVHPRQALHAHTLCIPHPRSGEAVTFESPLPEDLQALWRNPALALCGEPAATFESILEPPRAEPSSERRSFEPPSSEPPSFEPPSSERPSFERPSFERRSSEPPSSERPSFEPPSTERRSFEPPSSERPSTEEPSSEPPSTEHD